MPGSTFSSTPVLVGVVLTALCFVAAGSELRQGVLLAGLVVPTGVRTHLVLVRRRAAGRPISLLSSLGTLLNSAALTVVIDLWLIVVSLFTAILKDFDMGGLPLFALVSLTVWLMISLGKRRAANEAEHGAIRPDWRRIFRVRFTVRGMLVGIATVAFALWPVYLWRMRPTYTAIAGYEGFVADLCLSESNLMAQRAERCRKRASEGAAWDLDDEVSEDLKVCPYSNDGPGRSWCEQAEIWERASERSRLAAQRHLEISARYWP